MYKGARPFVPSPDKPNPGKFLDDWGDTDAFGETVPEELIIQTAHAETAEDLSVLALETLGIVSPDSEPIELELGWG